MLALALPACRFEPGPVTRVFDGVRHEGRYIAPNAYAEYARGALHDAYRLAATVAGLASHTCPGPDRPGKLRLIALTVTWSGRTDDPGPQLAQAPQDGCSNRAPTAAKASR